MIKKNQKVKVRFDDENPQLNGKEGVAVEDAQSNSPYWVLVDFNGSEYMLRGSELQMITTDDYQQ